MMRGPSPNTSRTIFMRRAPQAFVLAATWLLACAVTATGLLAQPSQQVGGRTMLARVVDAAGRAMVDFGVDDFLIEEAGQERDVLDVHVADYPVALLIDDLSLPEALDAIKTATARFIRRIGERPI